MLASRQAEAPRRRTARRLAAAGSRAVVLALLAAAALVGVAGPAAAHAELTSSEPADGARLDEAPDAVVLAFTEAVSVPDDGIRIVDASGDPVTAGTPEVDGEVVTVPVDVTADGSYVVTWRAVSADSHPINGAFTFTVGEGPAIGSDELAGILDGPSDTPWEIAGAVARALGYLGVLVAAGGGLYLAVVDPAGASRRLYRTVQVAAHVGSVGLLATLPIRAALITGDGASSLLESGVAADVLAEGIGTSLTITLLGLAALLAGVAIVGPLGRVLLAAGGAVAVAGFAAAGHTTETDPRWLATLADVVHAGAGAAWLGGLVCVAIALARLRDEDPTRAAGVVARFSALAGVAVFAVGIAGGALGWTQVRSFDPLVSTTYGRLLIAKVGLVAAVAALGAYNRFRLVPSVQRAPTEGGGWSSLRRLIRLEAVALVAATAITGVLVNVTPARAAYDPGPYRATAPAGDESVEVTVEEPEVGRAVLDIVVTDADGDRLEAEEVSVELRLPDDGIGPISRDAEPVGPGRWRVDGSDLTVAGRWEVTVDVRVSRFELESATVEVPIDEG